MKAIIGYGQFGNKNYYLFVKTSYIVNRSDPDVTVVVESQKTFSVVSYSAITYKKQMILPSALGKSTT